MDKIIDMKYSVLMSVYYKENPEYFRTSVQSMLNQTIKPDEIIVVQDGEMTDGLQQVIEELKNSKVVKFISLEKNEGLGKALNIGLAACRNELVARMDTDDISDCRRCEKQLAEFSKSKTLSLVGTAVAEFIDTPNKITAYKAVKTQHKEIVQQMKYRNPMNHPSIMFKKSEVIKAGSYQHWFLNEDYYLWIRMMQLGAVFHNINEPLVKMRITNETYLRRGGFKYFITQKHLFDYMFTHKLINIAEYSFNIVVRFAARILVPNKIRKVLYLKLLRKNKIASSS